MSESVEILNERLLNTYGRFDDGRSLWRIVYSDDQFEKRLSWYTDEGFELLTPRMVLLPKYKQWIHNSYILERLIPVPEVNKKEVVGNTSYEPVWVFQDKEGNPLPPKWEATQLVIRTVYQASAMSIGAKYTEPDKEAITEQRIEQLHQDLFGNETEVGDALAHKQAVVVPTKYGDNQ